MPITHAKVSGKSDGSDATQIQPSDWNDEHVGSGGGLPPQWTDGGNGDVTATTDDFSAPITFDATDPASNDAILVNVPDAGDISGNGYVFRVHDVPNDWHVADLDAWGSMLIKGPFDAGSGTGGIDIIRKSDGSHVVTGDTRGTFVFQGLATDSMGSLAFIEDVVLLRGDRSSLGAGSPGIGFFDKAGSAAVSLAAQQELTRTGVTAAQLWDVLEAYGLVKEP